MILGIRWEFGRIHSSKRQAATACPIKNDRLRHYKARRIFGVPAHRRACSEPRRTAQGAQGGGQVPFAKVSGGLISTCLRDQFDGFLVEPGLFCGRDLLVTAANRRLNCS